MNHNCAIVYNNVGLFYLFLLMSDFGAGKTPVYFLRNMQFSTDIILPGRDHKQTFLLFSVYEYTSLFVDALEIGRA